MLFYYQDFWPWIKLTTPWLLVIGGWYVIHRTTLIRERRKEKREEIDRVLEEIRAIESIAIDFHNSEVFDKKANSNITLRIDRLSRKLQAPPTFNELKITTQLMIEFRKTITLEHFDKSNFPSIVQRIMKGNPYPATSIEILIRDINSATDDLVDCIEAEKNNKFP
ncbi:hypothetical protein [Nitrosomonas sp.]|uniref:hypothetical protein n=1 Tax=Nitrosomonas sp. TaxID=42353 RepID=UPI0037C8AD30